MGKKQSESKSESNPKLRSDLFEVRDSGVHGFGLFAIKKIPKGTVLGQVEGKYTKRNGPYVLWLDDGRGFKVSNDLRYINHAAKPNAAYYDDLTVATIKSIRKGDEITHDYFGDGSEWPGD